MLDGCHILDFLLVAVAQVIPKGFLGRVKILDAIDHAQADEFFLPLFCTIIAGDLNLNIRPESFEHFDGLIGGEDGSVRNDFIDCRVFLLTDKFNEFADPFMSKRFATDDVKAFHLT